MYRPRSENYVVYTFDCLLLGNRGGKNLQAFYDNSRALAAADAKSSKTIAAVDFRFSHSVEQGDDDTSAGAADRMAESDSAAVNVDFVHVEAEFAAAVYGLSQPKPNR